MQCSAVQCSAVHTSHPFTCRFVYSAALYLTSDTLLGKGNRYSHSIHLFTKLFHSDSALFNSLVHRSLASLLGLRINYSHLFPLTRRANHHNFLTLSYKVEGGENTMEIREALFCVLSSAHTKVIRVYYTLVFMSRGPYRLSVSRQGVRWRWLAHWLFIHCSFLPYSREPVAGCRLPRSNQTHGYGTPPPQSSHHPSSFSIPASPFQLLLPIHTTALVPFRSFFLLSIRFFFPHPYTYQSR